MQLEICANSYPSALNAQEAGADRIELCSELSIGGITPSYGLLKKVSEELSIPAYVLIRPRSGGFNYSDIEFELMKENILLCKKLGFAGIVSGVLNEDHSIDIERTIALIELSKPLAFTFHRAFDCVPDPMVALKQLMELGVDRILTSGLASTAENGLDILKQLKAKSEGRIIILPGSGINAKNAHLFKAAGFEEIHTSSSVKMPANPKATPFDFDQTVSDPTTISSILKVIKNEV